MATQTSVTVVDDMTGEAGASTVYFAIDGIDYEIDLIEANYDRLVDSLAPFTEAARKAKRGDGRKTGTKPAGTARGSVGREQLAAIRAWARAAGHSVSDRGRISAAVKSAFETAHAGANQPVSVG